MTHHTLDISHITPLKIKTLRVERIGKIDIHIPKINLNKLIKQTKLTIQIPNLTRVIKKEVEKDINRVRTEGIHLDKQIEKVEKQVEKEVIHTLRNIENRIEKGAGDLLNKTLETLGNQSSNETDTSNNSNTTDTTNNIQNETINNTSIDTTSTSIISSQKTNYYYLAIIPLVFILI